MSTNTEPTPPPTIYVICPACAGEGTGCPVCGPAPTAIAGLAVKASAQGGAS